MMNVMMRCVMMGRRMVNDGVETENDNVFNKHKKSNMNIVRSTVILFPRSH